MEDDTAKYVDLPPQILADHCYGKPTPPPPLPTGAPSKVGSPAPVPVETQLQQMQQQQQQILIRQPPTIITEAHIHHQQQQHQESQQVQQHTVHHHPTYAQQQAHQQHRVYVPQNLVTIPAQGGDWRTAPAQRAAPSAIVVGTVATHHVASPVMIHSSPPPQQQFVAMVGAPGAAGGGGAGAQAVSSLSPTSIFADGFPVMEPVSVAPGDGGVGGYGANISAFPTVEVNQGGGFAGSQNEKSTKEEPDRRHQGMVETSGGGPGAMAQVVPTVSLASSVSGGGGASASAMLEKLPANILEGDEIELTDTSSGGNGGIM